MISDVLEKYNVSDEKWIWLFTIVSIVIYLSLYVFSGTSGRWMVWDNLDSTYVFYKILVDSGMLFAPNQAVIEQPLGGLPRGNLPSELSVITWLYVIFGPEVAYILNRIFMTVVGFVGMYLLLDRIVLKDSAKLVTVGVSLCFALLPFWPFGGLSVAGQPLALYALLRIRQQEWRWWHWTIIVALPFYSSLILSGFFFLVLASLILVYDILNRKPVFPLFASLSLFSLFYVVSEYRLFLDFFLASDYVSHRAEFGFFAPDTVAAAIKSTSSIFLSGQAHARSLHELVIVVLLVSIRVLWAYSVENRRVVLLLSLLFGIALISIQHGFRGVPPLVNMIEMLRSYVPMQFNRFYFLFPMLWMLLFALALAAIYTKNKQYRFVIVGVILLQVMYSYSQHELNRSSPTANEFFAKKQFSDISNFISEDKSNYRVASLGIHPSVSLYNGFYTLDGYFANYPLSYKHAFGSVIRGELEKNESLRSYFDNWGSRAYLFTHVTGRNMMNLKGNNIYIDDLKFDFSKFYALGGRYIISAVKINENVSPQLKYLKMFSDSDSAWDIFLYSVDSD